MKNIHTPSASFCSLQAAQLGRGRRRRRHCRGPTNGVHERRWFWMALLVSVKIPPLSTKPCVLAAITSNSFLGCCSLLVLFLFSGCSRLFSVVLGCCSFSALWIYPMHQPSTTNHRYSVTKNRKGGVNWRGTSIIICNVCPLGCCP